VCSVCSVVPFLAGNSGQSQVLRYWVFRIGVFLSSCGEQPLYFAGKLEHRGFHCVFFKLG